MKIEINININDNRFRADLEKVSQAIQDMRDQMSDSFNALTAEVDAAVTIEEGAAAMIDGLINEVAALGDAPTPDDMSALVAKLQASKADLAKAIANGTPAPPPAQPVTLTLTPTSITGSVGSDVSGSFSAGGGAAPYAFAADALWPADITLSGDGSFDGTPAAAESVTSVVTVTDANGVSAPFPISISVA